MTWISLEAAVRACSACLRPVSAAATRFLASTMLALFEGATHWRTASRWSLDVKAASSVWTRVTPSLNDFASLWNWVLVAVCDAVLARSVKAHGKHVWSLHCGEVHD